LQDKTSALITREKELRGKLAALNAVIPITVLREQIASLEEAKASLILQISNLSAEASSDEVSRVCKEDLDRIDQEWGKWKHQVASRKRIFLEFWAICTEVLPPNTTQAELKVCHDMIPMHHFCSNIVVNSSNAGNTRRGRNFLDGPCLCYLTERYGIGLVQKETSLFKDSMISGHQIASVSDDFRWDMVTCKVNCYKQEDRNKECVERVLCLSTLISWGADN
jgi:hypothetical protein